MLGFKLDVPHREGSVEAKTRPIYLDMQVEKALCIVVIALAHFFRLRPQ